ncbi:hypothetical protein, partial [Lactobacillus crispatus]|uniref:hypothetical protein n=1 Tax=Lactobacillus crispatus TaxID=47770 RepID=UPI00197BD003
TKLSQKPGNAGLFLLRTQPREDESSRAIAVECSVDQRGARNMESQARLSPFFRFASNAHSDRVSRGEGYPSKMIKKKRASLITYRQCAMRYFQNRKALQTLVKNL